MNNDKDLLTIGDIARDPQFVGYTKRQIEYAIDTHRIDPIRRVGIIRAFGVNQLSLILSAVRRTAQVQFMRSTHGHGTGDIQSQVSESEEPNVKRHNETE